MMSSLSARVPGSPDPQGAFRAAALFADEVEVSQGRPRGQTKIIRRFALQRNKTQVAAQIARVWQKLPLKQ
jgi:hypothetical protein